MKMQKLTMAKQDKHTLSQKSRKCKTLVSVLRLQCVGGWEAVLAGRQCGQCLWQLPVQLLLTSSGSKCGCRTTAMLTSDKMEVSFLKNSHAHCRLSFA